MVKVRSCSFCGYNIPPGRGIMFVQNSGDIRNFCTNKCRKSLILFKKNPRRTRWTKFYGKQ